ncbi:7387_t:CDS:2, partial [Gigaspora margarita]
HIDAYVCWFPSDFNDGHRIPSTDWKSDYNGEATILNAVATNNPPRSEQVLFRLYMDKLYITSGTVKELQASFTTLRFLPTYNIAQREDESFIMTYNQQKENVGYTQEYNQ